MFRVKVTLFISALVFSVTTNLNHIDGVCRSPKLQHTRSGVQGFPRFQEVAGNSVYVSQTTCWYEQLGQENFCHNNNTPEV